MNRIPQRLYVTEEQIAAQDSPDMAEGLRRFYRREQARRLDGICYGFLAFVAVSALLAGFALAAVFLGWIK